MTFDLSHIADEHIAIVAHRGKCGGNIPPNTLASYEIALKQGADMIEIDVDKTADGKLVIFHPTMEHAMLYSAERLKNLTWEEARRLRYVNGDIVPTQFGLNTLDEVFETFKGRCYINVDKFWGNPQEIAEAIHRHNIADQVLVKSSLSDKVLSVLEEVAPDLAFMPIVRNEHPMHEDLMRRNIRYVGTEVLFRTEDVEVCSPAFIEKMHRDGKLVWANAIIYNWREQLTAGHSDDTALCEDPDKGWGWLADRGFDLVQTDWPLMLKEYLVSAGKYMR